MKYRGLSLTLFLVSVVLLVLSIMGGGPNVAADALILMAFAIFLRYLDSKKMMIDSFPKEEPGEPVRFHRGYYLALLAALAVFILGCIRYL